MQEKIAFIADSGADVPQSYIEKYNIYELPLSIIFKDETFIDKVDITDQELFQKMEKEIPTTSLPQAEEIYKVFEEIQARGIEKVLAVTISSGLSGTFNAIRLAAQDFPDLDVHVIDTLNIGIGAGLVAVRAIKALEAGASFEDVKEATADIVETTDVFFAIPTLKYLEAGGRIGRVAGLLGGLLQITPVISCDDEGIYYPVSKSRGMKRALNKIKDHVQEKAQNYDEYYIACAYTGDEIDIAQGIADDLKAQLPNIKEIFLGKVSSALTVHTGPGLIGVGVAKA